MIEGLFIYFKHIHFSVVYLLITLHTLVDNISCFQLSEQKWEIQIDKPIALFHSNKK